MKNTFIIIIITLIFIFNSFVHPSYGTLTFTDATIEARVNYTPLMTWGCSFVDINNDGYLDIFIPNHYEGEPFLYINNGNGGFTEQASIYGLLRENIVPPDRWNYEDMDFHGNAWGDFDNDGDQDLYIASGYAGGAKSEPKRNHFLRNDGSNFVEIALTAGVDDGRGRGRTPMWIDYNNDGYLDLFLTNVALKGSPSRLFENNGDGTFTDVTQSAGLYNLLDDKDFEAAIWGDYDFDGDLDLFMSAFKYDEKNLPLLPSPLLFRNNGDGTFTDITTEAKLNENTTEWKIGTGIALGDYDNDGDLDLFIAQGGDKQGLDWDENSIKFYVVCNSTSEHHVNFFTTGNQVTFNLDLYGNDLKKEWVFIGQNCQNPDSLPFTLTEGEAYGEPLDCPDVVFRIWQDEDDKEWHISMKQSVTYPAINNNRTGWITTSGSFVNVTHNLPSYENLRYRSFLFRNNSDGTFSDVTTEANLEYLGWRSSVAWADFDNDGFLDLYIVNFDPFDSAPNSLYHNNGDGTFTEIAENARVTGTVVGRGDTAIVGDYNNDGFLDIFITNGRTLGVFGEGPYILYKNNGNNNSWLKIKTVGTIGNRDGIGAKIWVTVQDTVQYREQIGGTTLYGQNSPLIHFGLGGASKIDRLRIEWLSGRVEEYTDIDVNQTLTLIEPGVSWEEVISIYNEYVRANKAWADVISTYQLYVRSQP